MALLEMQHTLKFVSLNLHKCIQKKTTLQIKELKTTTMYTNSYKSTIDELIALLMKCFINLKRVLF